MSGVAAQDGPAEPDAIRPPGDAVAMAAISGIPYDALTARPLRGRSLLLRTFRAILPFLVIAAVWQTASLFTKPYLFPGLGSIAKKLLDHSDHLGPAVARSRDVAAIDRRRQRVARHRHSDWTGDGAFGDL